MRQQTSIYIPKPCHEDWNKMTPTQQGKFCAACNKQVVDFSLMTDNQVLNFLSHQSGKLCGRFDAEQLQRPLIETRIKKKKSWWMALTMPLLFLFDRSGAQENKVVGDTVYQVEDATMGAIARIFPGKEIIVKGKVVDENDKPLPFATLTQKGTINGTTTDSLGNFSLTIQTNDDSVTLSASYVGFSVIEKRIKISDADISNVTIVLKEQPIGLSDVVVTSNMPFYGRLGGAFAICTRITAIQKIDTSFKKLIGISNVYPNPAVKGSSIHIKIKEAGSYQMHLLDNQSRLIQAEEINVDAKNSITQIQLESNITAGMYYLRLINEQTKKQYIEKLIIQ